MAQPKQRSPEERVQSRSKAVAAALKKARDARGLTLRELARRAGVGPSTLSRLENPDSVESPKLETLEALAEALEWPLPVLIGEPGPEGAPNAIAEWPEALQGVLSGRGGFVTTTERAFIEERLATIVHDPMRVAMGMPQVQDDPDYWQSQLQLFRDAPRWRAIETLMVYGSRINHDVLRGLALIVGDATRGELPSIEGVETEVTALLREMERATKKTKAKPNAGPSKTAVRKKTRRKKARP